MKSIFSQLNAGHSLFSFPSISLSLFAGVLILAGLSTDYGQVPRFAGSSLEDGCGPVSSAGVLRFDDYSSDALLFWVDPHPNHIRHEVRADCCSEAFKSCGSCAAGDQRGPFQLGPYCRVYDALGGTASTAGTAPNLKACQQCMIKACPNISISPGSGGTTTKVRIATTVSCTDNPNEGFKLQEGVSVSIGGKTFTSNANGVIETELPAGWYNNVSATWKDNVLGYVTQNGVRLKRIENGSLTVNLLEKVETLEFRMLTCDPEGLPKARAVVSEIGGGSIEVITTRGSQAKRGLAFVGRQLRDGDVVIVSGTARLKWLADNTVISFEDPKRLVSILIGPDSSPGGTTCPGGKSSVEVLQGVINFLSPQVEDRDLPRDENGNIIKFGASSRTVCTTKKGTVFSLGHDEQTQVSTVSVKEGVVTVTPKNRALPAFDLTAGQAIDVSPTNVGRVKRINIWTDTNSVGQFIGCFKDTNDFDLNGFVERILMNTPKRCIDSCRSRGYEYAAMQYGASCLCGNSYGRYGRANNCDYKCPGDPTQICGGYAANSVYSTSQTPPAPSVGGRTGISPVPVPQAACRAPDINTTFEWWDNGRYLGTIKLFAGGSTQVCCWTSDRHFWRADGKDLIIYVNGTETVTRLIYFPNTCIYSGNRDITSQRQDGVRTDLKPKR